MTDKSKEEMTGAEYYEKYGESNPDIPSQIGGPDFGPPPADPIPATERLINTLQNIPDQGDIAGSEQARIAAYVQHPVGWQQVKDKTDLPVEVRSRALDADAIKLREMEREATGKTPHTIEWWLSQIQQADAQERDIAEVYETNIKQPIPGDVKAMARTLGYQPVKTAEVVVADIPKAQTGRKELTKEELQRDYTPILDTWVKNDDIQRLKQANEQLYQVLMTKGFAAYERQVEKLDKEYEEFQREHVIIGDKAMKIDDWNKLTETEKSIAMSKGFDALNEKNIDPMKEKVVKEYREKGLPIGFDFDPKREVIQEDTEEAPRSPAREPSPTDTREQRLEIIRERVKAIQDKVKDMPLPEGVPLWAAGTVPFAVAEPTPIGEIIAAILIGGAAVAYGLQKSGVNIENIGKEALAARDYFTDKFGRAPTANDVILVDNAGNAFSVPQIDPKGIQIPGLTPPQVDTGIPGIKPTQIDRAIPALRPSAIDSKIPGIRGGELVVNPVISDPVVSPEELKGHTAGVLFAEAAVLDAESKVRTSAATMPIDFDRVLEDIINSKGEAESRRAVEEFRQTTSRIVVDRDAMRKFREALSEYEVKKRLLENARKQYVASLNPSPVSGGKLSPMAKNAVYGFVTAGTSNAVKDAVMAGQKTYTQALQMGATETLAENQAKQAVANQIQTYLANQVQTKTKLNIQQLVDTLTKQATKTDTQAQTATRPLSRTADMATTATATASATATPTTPMADTPTRAVPDTARIKPKPRLLFLDDIDKKKRQELSTKDGIVYWKQGKLKAGEVWRVKFAPYGPGDKMTLIGTPPAKGENITGKGSATLTLKHAGQRPKKAVTYDQGAVDPTIVPTRKGVNIYFEKDKQYNRQERNTPVRIKPIAHRRKGSKQGYVDIGNGIIKTKHKQKLKLY